MIEGIRLSKKDIQEMVLGQRALGAISAASYDPRNARKYLVAREVAGKMRIHAFDTVREADEFVEKHNINYCSPYVPPEEGTIDIGLCRLIGPQEIKSQ